MNATKICQEAWDPVDEDDVYIENIASIITIVICIIGIAFNLFNIIIATSRPSKGSLHIYPVALSVVDLLILLCFLPLRGFRCGGGCPPPTLAAQVFEKFVAIPLSNILATMDTYITVAWSIERLTYIHSPRFMANKSSAPIQAVIMSAMVSVLLHIPHFYMWQIDNGIIKLTSFTQSKRDLDYGTVLMVLTKAVPIATLSIVNVLLIIAVNRATHSNKALTGQHTPRAKKLRSQTRLNILLIVVICLMIAGNMPIVFVYPAFSVKLFHLEVECLSRSLSYRTFRAIANLIILVHFASNFLIYYAINRNYKEQVHRVMDKVVGCRKPQVNPF